MACTISNDCILGLQIEARRRGNGSEAAPGGKRGPETRKRKICDHSGAEICRAKLQVRFLLLDGQQVTFDAAYLLYERTCLFS